MLNGIGGRTIAEAKKNMTHRESLQWVEYIRQRGSLNIARRIEKQIEFSVALLCATVNNSAGGKAKVKDFLPAEKAPETYAESIDQLAAVLKSVAKPGAKKMKYTRTKSAPK